MYNGRKELKRLVSNSVYHSLKGRSLKRKLLKKCVVGPIVLHGTGNRVVHIEYALNMSLCDSDEWKKVETSAIEYGVVDHSKQNADGSHGVRRDLTTQEINELPYWPIAFNDKNEVTWLCKWNNNDDPAFFISKLFPKETFQYDMYYEGEWDGGFIVKDGTFTPTEEWKNHLENKTHQESAEEPDGTLPF